MWFLDSLHLWAVIMSVGVSMCRFRKQLPKGNGKMTIGSGCVVHRKFNSDGSNSKEDVFLVTTTQVVTKQELLAKNTGITVEFLNKRESFSLDSAEEYWQEWRAAKPRGCSKNRLKCRSSLYPCTNLIAEMYWLRNSSLLSLSVWKRNVPCPPGLKVMKSCSLPSQVERCCAMFFPTLAEETATITPSHTASSFEMKPTISF